MGNVIFNTNVTKTVNIDKNVNYDVAKNVDTNVNLRGSLASAEASADAVGGGNGGQTGSRTVVPFNPDDLSLAQQVNANPALTNPNESTVVLPGSDTDFANPVQRTLLAEVLGAVGEGDLSVQIVVPGRLTFDQGDETFSNAYARWDLPAGAAPFAQEGNADVLANPGDYLFQFNDISFNPGTAADGSAATVRVSFIVEDGDGDRAITTVAFVPGDEGQGFTAADDLDIVAPFAAFINAGIAGSVPPGTIIDSDPVTNARIVLIGTEANPAVDLGDLASFQVLLEDRPGQAVGDNTFSSADFFAFDSVIDETLSVSGTDAATDLVWTNVEMEDRRFNLAETETFAQVTEDGSYAFSDSLAAFSGSLADDFML